MNLKHPDTAERLNALDNAAMDLAQAARNLKRAVNGESVDGVNPFTLDAAVYSAHSAVDRAYKLLNTTTRKAKPPAPELLEFGGQSRESSPYEPRDRDHQ